MPTIPTYNSTLVPATGGGGSLEAPITSAAAATQRLGQTLTAIGKKFKQAEDVSQYNESMKNLQQDLLDTRFSFAERPDYQNFKRDFEKTSEEIRKKYLEEMKNNSLIGQFESRMNGAILSTESAVRTDARRKQVDQGRATYLSSLDSLADSYGKASEAEKHHILIQAQELTQMNVDVGYINNVEAQKLTKKFKYDALKSDVWYSTKAMGYEEGIKWLQNTKNAPDLKREDRNSMIAELRRDMTIDRVEKERQEREMNDKNYSAFLEKAVAWEDGRGPAPTSQEIVTSPITDPRIKQNLLNFVDSIGKKKNPYLNSNPETFGKTLTDIISQPDQWSKRKIMLMAGKGLSNRDALTALNLYENVTRGVEPKKHSQLGLALQTVSKAATEGMFIGKDLKTEATDKEIVNNWTIYSKSVREIINRAEEGEDPIEVAHELMKPYVDKKVEGWLDKAWNWSFRHKKYEEEAIREQAIQELQDEGELITEGAINDKIKELRGEKK